MLRLRPVLRPILVLSIVGPLLSHGSTAHAGLDKRSVRISRLNPAPIIEGDLSDDAWNNAALLDGFLQVEPVEGGEPSEHTEIRLGYDDDHIYLALYCYDKDQGGIIGTQMARDARLDPDDRVELLFDTFNDDRNAFWFQIGPAGSRGDALIGGSTFNKEWDTQWEGEARITEVGWFAEIAIPTQSLSFDPHSTTWGFNAKRVIKRRSETTQWASPTQDIRFFTVSSAGEITGISGLEQGLGLDIKPFASSTAFNLRDPDDRRFMTSDFGGDVVWRITPSLTSLFTLNTDFAETEVDSVQVNLTRFPLFFPEKREFFLEDGDVFNFADLTAGRSGRPDIIPFFSRRIGLSSEGEEVRILGGGKLTGRAGPFRIGVLDVLTDESDETGRKNLIAARVSREVLDESDAGFIFTHGAPNSTGQNSLVGADFNYRTTEFLDGKNLRASVFGLKSFTSQPDGDGESFGASVSYPNDLYSWSMSARHIAEDFNPSLGFIRRQGIRRYAGDFFFQPRLGSWVRQLFFGFRSDLVTTTGNATDSWSVQVVPLKVEFESGEEFRIEGGPEFEKFDEPFDIIDDVTVPGDEYQDLRYEVEFETADKRPLSAEVGFAGGTFLTGHRNDASVELNYRPCKNFLASVEYEINDVHLDEGDFVVRLARTRIDVNFSPQLTWSNFVQWDNVSDAASINSRVRYIYKDGQELFLVFNKSWFSEDSSYLPLNQELTLKLEYVFRF